MTSEPTGPRDIIEIEIAVFVRALESFGRQSDVYAKLDRAGYILLRALSGLGSVSVNALAAALGLEASTVTRQAAALWDAKLLERQVDPADRRSNILSLTAAGERMMRDVLQRRNDALASFMQGWTGDELRSFAYALSRLNDSIVAQLGGALGRGFRVTMPPPADKGAAVA